MRAPQEYVAIQAIPGPTGVRAYNPGDDVPASAVENLGLQVGVQVLPSSPDVIPRPAGNAPRADWEAYWLAQRLPKEEVDGMTRDEMAAKEPITPDPEQFIVASTALPGEAVAGVVVRNPLPDNVAEQAAEQLDQPSAALREKRERPGQNARKPEWVEYAVYRGMDRSTADDSTIPQLQECDYDTLFGPEPKA